MKTGTAYIGDKLMATGFQMTGVRVYVPEARTDAIWASFQEACEDTDLVLISQSYADLIATQLKRFQQHAFIPAVLCIPEAGMQHAPARKTIQAAKTSLGLSQ